MSNKRDNLALRQKEHMTSHCAWNGAEAPLGKWQQWLAKPVSCHRADKYIALLAWLKLPDAQEINTSNIGSRQQEHAIGE